MKNSNIFTSPHWHSADADKQNLVVAASLNLHVSSLWGGRLAEMSGEPIIQYNDLAENNDEDANILQTEILPKLKQDNIDLLYFHNVRADSNLYRQVKDIGQIIAHKKAPFIDLTQYTDLDGYVKSLSSASRKSKRRALKKLEAKFEVEFKTLVDGQINAALFDQVIQLKINQLSRMGLTSRLFENPAEIKNLKNIILKPNKEFQCVFSLLNCDGRIAAAEIGYLFDGTYYSFLGAMDETFQPYSPGSCQLLKTIEWALGQKVKIFDFLAPEDAYKFSWTDNAHIEVYDFILPLSLKGKFIGKAYLQTLRPLLKKIYLSFNARK